MRLRERRGNARIAARSSSFRLRSWSCPPRTHAAGAETKSCTRADDPAADPAEAARGPLAAAGPQASSTPSHLNPGRLNSSRPIPAPLAVPEPKPPNPAPLATPAPAGPIEFTCPSCHKVVRTPAAAGGKKGKCPHCQEVVQIPAKSNIPTAKPMPVAKPITAKPLPAKPTPKSEPEIIDLEEMPASGTPGLTPLGTGLIPLGSGLTPLGSGLTPLGGGLTPLPGPTANPYGGGLTPLGLTPLGPAPAGPAAPDPFAGLTPLSSYPAVAPPAGVNPLGLPASSLGRSPNPYDSPSPFGAGYGQPAYQPRTINDSHRRGLAWERDPSMDSFGETMNLVLGSPQEAFSNMRRTGGLGNPIGFLIIGTVIGQIANAIYGIILSFIQAVAAGGNFPIEGLIIGGALQLVGGVIGAVVLVPIFTLIIAGIYHLLLLMVGGANAGYEATFRSVCFVSGSTAVLLAIPCVGGLIAFFYGIIVLIHAFANAHETSGGKAAFSVLGTMVGLVICCAGCGFVFVMPIIMQAVNRLP